ncbi:MAG: LysR family transcriptional regulator [Bdellovibrio sp.]|nr:LysR family transcriptional regulator [Bdellovibrio sp.]
MFNLHYELSVLSRAVAYSNLSAASLHVGLSQPQLSRIISKLEGELKLTLLDREAKRKSSWTQAAFQLTKAYSKIMHALEKELEGLIKASEPTHIKICALEGMAPLSIPFCHLLLKTTSVQIVELDVQDLNKLEEGFFNGDYSLIFSLREPGKKKYKYTRAIGYQTIEKTQRGAGVAVLSSFEYESQLEKTRTSEKTKLFVSNSLQVRKDWLHMFGGTGTLPSKVSPTKKLSTDQAVYLVGHELLPQMFWTKVVKICKF